MWTAMAPGATGRGWATALAISLCVGGANTVGASAPVSAAAPDLTLKGDRAGTVFRSLTVEGENRVQIRFERPALTLSIDPAQAPGLVLDDAMDILDRTLPDLVTPLLLGSTVQASPHGPRPWLQAYERGPVARFTSDMTGVFGWKLQVVDSRGQTAMVFAGQKDLPAEISWDGRRLDGSLAPPGYTYSFVLEARDRAGNQRRIVGDGLGLPAYRQDGPAGPEFMVSGAQWQQATQRRGGDSEFLLEAASLFNLRSDPARGLRVVATHRSAVEAAALAESVCVRLRPLVGGDPARVVAEAVVEPGAPAEGTLHLLVSAERALRQTPPQTRR